MNNFKGILTLLLLVGGLAWFLSRTKRRTRRAQLIAEPFPAEWEAVLEKLMPQYLNLPLELQTELQKDIQAFIADVSFEGCGGLIMSDEIKVTIAGQACMLLLNRPMNHYPKLRTVLVYPDTYVVGGKGYFGGKEEPRSVRLGESWTLGTVVLSWNSVKRGAYNINDGHNVAMHEFAHQLDQEDGVGDGAPILEQRSSYSLWAKVFSKEFEVLQRKVARGKRSVLDDYGATNPAEFFAVATETFYEKPRQLKKNHAALYNALQTYYRVDPVEWEK